MYAFLLTLGLGVLSCEEEFIPDLPTQPLEIVVEGYIEAGDQPLPPYVLLTRSVPFFSEIDPDQLSGLFIHDAEVRVTEGENEVVLEELCLDALTPEQRALVAEVLNLDADSLQLDICLYADLSGRMIGEAGKQYDLHIEVEGKTLRASTTIPEPVPLDSLRFRDPPGEPSDSLAQLRAWIEDPPEVNHYRYFTRVNDAPFQSGLNSVIDDRLFNGQRFTFPLPKAESRDADFDPTTFGLYHRGDTVGIKWASIDAAHYAFWNTLEFNAANQGPFSSYTRIDSNVEGGLGIWGGLAAFYYEEYVPED